MWNSFCQSVIRNNVCAVLYLHVEAVLQLAASRGRRQDLSAGSLVSFPHPASPLLSPFISASIGCTNSLLTANQQQPQARPLTNQQVGQGHRVPTAAPRHTWHMLHATCYMQCDSGVWLVGAGWKSFVFFLLFRSLVISNLTSLQNPHGSILE